MSLPADASSPAAALEPVIMVTRMSKRFGRVRALVDASLTIGPGCTGLLGANGAGKSTLIKLVLGLLAPDAGEARIAGLDPVKQPLALRALVGYMPEHDCLPSDWLAQDFVRYMGELHGLPRRVAIQRANDTLYHVGLGEERFRAIGGFSTGMKQRVKLAQALVHDPTIMLLDEPTNGLDPAGRDEMLDLIARVTNQMGIHVLLSSHLLADVERVAGSVVIMAGGQVMVQGSLAELMTATPQVIVRTHEPPAALQRALERRGLTVRLDELDLQVAFETPDVFDAIRDAAVETGTGLTYLKRRVRTLEDIYLAGQDPTPVSAAS
ncbi:MAG TPA: ABC transporter ATP-binding protein [Chloroflexota bacterium]|nr:ABC transporter ATP-binding protein [Chloroflexota bacterium]